MVCIADWHDMYGFTDSLTIITRILPLPLPFFPLTTTPLRLYRASTAPPSLSTEGRESLGVFVGTKIYLNPISDENL